MKTAFATVIFFALLASGWAQTEKTLYNFVGGTKDGGNPYTGLIQDVKGHLYGATSNGGTGGGGIVYKLTRNAKGKWKRTILYSFPAYNGDGNGLEMQHVAMDKRGALYGVTVGGGANNVGTVFKLSPGKPLWKETILHSFTNSDGNGFDDGGGLAIDAKGNLYGTTNFGGDPNCNCGVVFELSPGKKGAWTYYVLHAFTGFPQGAKCGDFYDGASPGNNTPAVDSAGNVYGTTELGGNGCANNGTVWQVSPVQGGGWNYSILHYMGGNADCCANAGGVLDTEGNFYYAEGGGQIVALVKSQGYALQYLYQPQNCSQQQPCPTGNYDTVTFDKAGNLYWASWTLTGPNLPGAVSELSPNGQGGWDLTVLYGFPHDEQEGGGPWAGVMVDASGNVYGTCVGGGTNNEGTVWETTP
ncbi:MAG: choice-of-anchor tandem repeat GloVer-containing protein [Terriglobales bacterium]